MRGLLPMILVIKYTVCGMLRGGTFQPITAITYISITPVGISTLERGAVAARQLPERRCTRRIACTTPIYRTAETVNAKERISNCKH